MPLCEALHNGKTHLAVAFGPNDARALKRVLFYTAEDLVNEFVTAEVSHRLSVFLDSLSRLGLLIIDEPGHLSISKQPASLFFKLISRRYEKGPVIITTNRPFEEWGDVFNDDVPRRQYSTAFSIIAIPS